MTHLPAALTGDRLRITSPPTFWRCEPGWSWHARPLANHLLWYVLDGAGHLRLAGHDGELAPGTGVVFEPGDEPVAGHDPRRRLLIFGMHFEALAPHADAPDAEAPDAEAPDAEAPDAEAPDAEPPDDVAPPDRWCRVRDQELAAALARRCDLSYRRGDPLGRRQSQLCLEQLLCLLWEDSIHPAPGPADAALDEITHVIRQDPGRRWTVAELASRVALSRAQFTRRFTAHTGLPPARYLIRARVDRARQLLTETNLSATQVAGLLGYTDLAHFSRQYKRHTGHPPGRDR